MEPQLIVDEGYEKGEMCNRDGCVGIIDEREKEGSCSCHISPPCSTCVDDRHYCPVCDWQGVDEQRGYGNYSPEQVASFKKQRDLWDEQRDSFYRKYNGKELADKLEVRHESHTHFSMIKIGVFPPNTETRQSLLIHVEGSWGGKFEMFNAEVGKFKYIAYTD